MTIYRDGKSIELTNKELQNAFYEYQEYEQKERVKTVLADYDVEFTEDDVDEIISITNSELDECDSYWDIEIDMIRDAIVEHFNLDESEDN